MKLTLFVFLLLCNILAVSQNESSVGVMVLAHGGSDEWNSMVEKAVVPIASKYQTEIAFGMANPYTMQKAISDLESKGINRIVVVQLFISSFSFIPRQNEYLLGLRDEMTQRPVVMSHGKGMHSTMNHSKHVKDDPWKNPLDSFPRLAFTSEIILTDPLNDHLLVADILLENANRISEDKSNEILVLVGHGPLSEADNTNWVLKMESLGK